MNGKIMILNLYKLQIFDISLKPVLETTTASSQQASVSTVLKMEQEVSLPRAGSSCRIVLETYFVFSPTATIHQGLYN